jgi:hypothetical protein
MVLGVLARLHSNMMAQWDGTLMPWRWSSNTMTLQHDGAMGWHSNAMALEFQHNGTPTRWAPMRWCNAML